jgi:hypothetical protein
LGCPAELEKGAGGENRDAIWCFHAVARIESGGLEMGPGSLFSLVDLETRLGQNHPMRAIWLI